MKRSPRRSRAFWLEHARCVDQSEQAISAYALEHGLSVDMLYRWRARFRREGALVRSMPAHQRIGDFVQAKVAKPAPSIVRVTFPNGCGVELSGGADAAALEVVLRSVSSL